MRIRLLILTLLIIGVHQHIQAQYMLGTTGMMNIPTADRQKPGTVMLGGNYLPKQMMPARFDYNTGNYFVSISFFSFLELAYRETLIKGDYVSSKPKYNQQDRSYSIRLCVWKEGKFLPGIALGANDPIADKGANTFQSYYGVITKGFHLGGEHYLSASLGYYLEGGKNSNTKWFRNEQIFNSNPPFGMEHLPPGTSGRETTATGNGEHTNGNGGERQHDDCF